MSMPATVLLTLIHNNDIALVHNYIAIGKSYFSKAKRLCSVFYIFHVLLFSIKGIVSLNRIL
jgi:hypothetical protein